MQLSETKNTKISINFERFRAPTFINIPLWAVKLWGLQKWSYRKLKTLELSTILIRWKLYYFILINNFFKLREFKKLWSFKELSLRKLLCFERCFFTMIQTMLCSQELFNDVEKLNKIFHYSTKKCSTRVQTPFSTVKTHGARS